MSRLRFKFSTFLPPGMAVYRNSHPLRRAVAFVFVLFAGLVLLKNISLNVRRPDASNPPAACDNSTLTAVPNGNFEDAPEGDIEFEIAGYWKEVRAELGLAPLPDTASVVPPFLASSDHSDERRGRRLGRLNPALRRRQPPSSITGFGLVEQEPARTARADPDAVPEVPVYMPDGEENAPRMSVRALAASFRAIAAQSLKPQPRRPAPGLRRRRLGMQHVHGVRKPN